MVTGLSSLSYMLPLSAIVCEIRSVHIIAPFVGALGNHNNSNRRIYLIVIESEIASWVWYV